MPLPEVSRILRHSHVGITARVYAHALALDQGEQEVMERLGELLVDRVAVSVPVNEPYQPSEMAPIRQ